MQKQSLFIKGSWMTRGGAPPVILKEGSQLGKGVQREAAPMGGRAMVELPSGLLVLSLLYSYLLHSPPPSLSYVFLKFISFDVLAPTSVIVLLTSAHCQLWGLSWHMLSSPERPESTSPGCPEFCRRAESYQRKKLQQTNLS